jgi:hypothetical protein
MKQKYNLEVLAHLNMLYRFLYSGQVKQSRIAWLTLEILEIEHDIVRGGGTLLHEPL